MDLASDNLATLSVLLKVDACTLVAKTYREIERKHSADCQIFEERYARSPRSCS